METGSRDAAPVCVVLLSDVPGRLCFHLRHNDVKKKKNKLGTFLLARVRLVAGVPEAGRVGSLGRWGDYPSWAGLRVVTMWPPRALLAHVVTGASVQPEPCTPGAGSAGLWRPRQTWREAAYSSFLGGNHGVRNQGGC